MSATGSFRELSDLDGLGLVDTDQAPGLKCEIKTYEARYNSKGLRVLLSAGIQKEKRRYAVERDHDAALVFMRYYNPKNDLDYTELEIRSPHVRTALQKVVDNYPGIDLHSRKVVLRNLPKVLFHYRKELQEYGAQLGNDVAKEHIGFCLRHMLTSMSTEIMSYRDHMTTKLHPGLEFELLWMAFRPGELLYHKASYAHCALKLQSMDRSRSCSCHSACAHGSWKIKAHYLAYNGIEFGRVTQIIDISPYEGHKTLHELLIFPLMYHPAQDKLRKSLVQRGRKFIGLRGVHHRYYRGMAQVFSSVKSASLPSEDTNRGFIDDFVEGRVIVDASYFGGARQRSRILLDDLHRIQASERELSRLSDEDFLICSPSAPGFSLRQKRWCFFSVDKIADVMYNADAFDSLLLPDAQKQIILALVRAHTDTRLTFDDIIAGKGKGMVALLHGEPGVGKTLTAESVADYTRRPLYTISSGELGVETASVEANLSIALQLATKWNAIVLIDEADVFLEQRRAKDLQRNALVSIFLRILEYYEGIMFLTTNRISSFDRAFKSRIHVAIKYPELAASARRDLWRTFAMNTAANTSVEWMDDRFLDTISAKNLNGRQIKNIFRTAQAMAISSNEPIGRSHIETALKTLEDFEVDFEENATQDAERGERKAKRRRIA